MPIERCTKDNKSGYRYGPTGTCYIGSGAREKARKQGQAIEISKHKAEDIGARLVKSIIEISEKKE